MGLQLSEVSALDIDMIEVLNTFFALVWTEKVYQALVPTDKARPKEERKGWARNPLRNLDS